MHIAICDDNKDELSLISSLLDAYQLERNATISYHAFHSATELLSATKSGAYDLYLLDIIMPAINGIEAAREIRSKDRVNPIIFLTSSPEFAVASYSVKANNYLLKPVTREKLFFALDDIRDSFNEEKVAAVVVKSINGIEKIPLAQLTHVEALDRKVIYYLASGKSVECISIFSEVCEELLNYSEFIRSHRSYLVNMNYIGSIRHSQIILQTGASIPIAQRRTAELKERYLTFQMEVE